MLLKEYIGREMVELAKDPMVRFIGYNLAYGSKCYGTLSAVPEDKIIEMPIAEYLMSGIAIGMAMNGFKPVLIFERQDFIWMAADQIINHLDKIYEMSMGEFKSPVLVRVITGTDKPLDPGPQHCQDYTAALLGKFLLHDTEVKQVINKHDIPLYKHNEITPKILIEYRALYEREQD